jgi:hypothetical protein
VILVQQEEDVVVQRVLLVKEEEMTELQDPLVIQVIQDLLV